MAEPPQPEAGQRDPRTREAGRARRLEPHRAWLAIAIALLLLALVSKVWRATLEASLWMDEVYTLQLVRHDWRGIVDFARLDFGPPLYYLLLKGWLTAASWLGIEPSLLLARSLNVVVWVALAVAVPRLGAGNGRRGLPAALAVAVVGSAHAVDFTHDLRSYGLAFVGLTLAFLLVVRDLVAPAGAGRERWRWLAYVAAAELALWSHLLAWPVLLLLAGAWLGGRLALARRAEPRRPLWPGVLAHLTAFAAASPWLASGLGQVAGLQAAKPGWMTPPSTVNLVRVFVEWLPLGRS